MMQFFFSCIWYIIHEFRNVAASWTQHCEHCKSMKYWEAYHVLHHSLPDGTLQVIVNILVLQRFTLWGNMKTCVTRMMHNILVIIILLTESHSARLYPNLFKWSVCWSLGTSQESSSRYVWRKRKRFNHQ